MTPKPGLPPVAETAGVVLREASSALHAATKLPEDPEWMDLSYQEKTKWGVRVAPSVLATLLVTQPKGWVELSAEVVTIAQRWLASIDPREPKL